MLTVLFDLLILNVEEEMVQNSFFQCEWCLGTLASANSAQLNHGTASVYLARRKLR